MFLVNGHTRRTSVPLVFSRARVSCMCTFIPVIYLFVFRIVYAQSEARHSLVCGCQDSGAIGRLLGVQGAPVKEFNDVGTTLGQAPVDQTWATAKSSAASLWDSGRLAEPKDCSRYGSAFFLFFHIWVVQVPVCDCTVMFFSTVILSRVIWSTLPGGTGHWVYSSLM